MAKSPKIESNERVAQSLSGLSFASANPDKFPIAYAGEIWDNVDATEQPNLAKLLGASAQYDQHAINEAIAAIIGDMGSVAAGYTCARWFSEFRQLYYALAIEMQSLIRIHVVSATKTDLSALAKSIASTNDLIVFKDIAEGTTYHYTDRNGEEREIGGSADFDLLFRNIGSGKIQPILNSPIQ